MNSIDLIDRDNDDGNDKAIISNKKYSLKGDCDGRIDMPSDFSNTGLVNDKYKIGDTMKCVLFDTEYNKELKVIKEEVVSEDTGMGNGAVWGNFELGVENKEGDIYIIEHHYDLGDSATVTVLQYKNKDNMLVEIGTYSLNTYWLMEAYDKNGKLISESDFLDLLCTDYKDNYHNSREECEESLIQIYQDAADFYEALDKYSK